MTTNWIPEGFTTDERDAETVAFWAKRNAMMASKPHLAGKTVSEYLADPSRVERIVGHKDVY